MSEELNVQEEKYDLKLTDWERDALFQIIENGNYKGTDIDLLYKLKQKIVNCKDT